MSVPFKLTCLCRLACILLATKVGNLHLNVNELSNKIPGASLQAILDHEFILMSEISFNILVPDLDAALQGYYLLLQVLFAMYSWLMFG